jgi:two-component system chemotaxis response regulator CheY
MVIERSGLAEKTPHSMIQLLSRFVDRSQATLRHQEYQPQQDLLGLMKIGFKKITDNNSKLTTHYLDLCSCGIEKILHSLVDGQGVDEINILKEEFLAYLGKVEDVTTPPKIESILPQLAIEDNNNCRILIIEDEIISRRLLKKNLSLLGSCDEASSASEGLISFMMAIDEGKPYEIIFLDIMMPGMDGLNLLKILRGVEEEHAITPDKLSKVVMVSGRKDSQAILGSFKSGCNGYLVKPIEPTKLNETLDNLYSKNKLEYPEILPDSNPK